MAVEFFPIEFSHIMMFSRAIGDDNPIYVDPASARDASVLDSVIAPPTFTQAGAQFDPDYRLRPKANQPWFGSGKTASGVLERSGEGGALHAEQHFEYFRPVRPGDVLRANVTPGKTWEKEGKRAGKLVFKETITEYRDQNGALVVTARGVSVRTERPAEQG